MSIEYDQDFYDKIHRLANLYMRHIYKLNISGLDNIPDRNYILAGNHLNILDACLLLTYKDDHVRYVVDNKLYKYKLWEIFFKKLGTIGINPDERDVTALKNIVDLLNQGENIGIFPEGHTHDKDIDLEYKKGVARISRITDTPIVPFGIYGSYKPFSEIILNIGEPINYKESSLSKDKIDDDLEQRIKSLIKRK